MYISDIRADILLPTAPKEYKEARRNTKQTIMGNQFNHLLIVSNTGTYLCTNMGTGANYLIKDGKFLFCRPEKYKDELGFQERLGEPIDIIEITQKERMNL